MHNFSFHRKSRVGGRSSFMPRMSSAMSDDGSVEDSPDVTQDEQANVSSDDKSERKS